MHFRDNYNMWNPKYIQYYPSTHLLARQSYLTVPLSSQVAPLTQPTYKICFVAR